MAGYVFSLVAESRLSSDKKLVSSIHNLHLQCSDLVPALLAHLDVKHVALICHSNGTIYLLNTILHLRHILHPTRPYIAILAPWVDPSHSGRLKSLAYVPDAILSKSPIFVKFFANNITPALMFSSGVIESIGKNSTTGVGSDTPEFMDYDPEIKRLEPELNKIFPKLLFSENITGGSDEAFLCLKRGKCTWGAFKDYDDAVPMVVKQEQDLAVNSSVSNGRKPEKLRVEVFFAENDSMVGNSGEDWFKRCWEDAAPGDYITYSGETVLGTGHEDIFSPETGVIDRIMATTVKSFADELARLR